jgi:1,4-alpha-glucan branching enzyme
VNRPVARVTFILPNSIWADTIYLVGDFNGWNVRWRPFQRDRQGRWILSVDLELGRVYQFRYLRDDAGWMYDMQADAYVPNLCSH